MEGQSTIRLIVQIAVSHAIKMIVINHIFSNDVVKPLYLFPYLAHEVQASYLGITITMLQHHDNLTAKI